MKNDTQNQRYDQIKQFYDSWIGLWPLWRTSSSSAILSWPITSSVGSSSWWWWWAGRSLWPSTWHPGALKTTESSSSECWMLKWMLLCFCQVSVVVAINFLSEARKLRVTPIPVTDILNAKWSPTARWSLTTPMIPAAAASRISHVRQEVLEAKRRLCPR